MTTTPPVPAPVAVIAVDDVVAFDLGIASQVFGAAVTAADQPLYEVHVCSAGGRPVRTSAGFDAAVAFGLETVDSADTVVVPGPAGTSAAAHGDVDPQVAQALRRAAARGARIVSICT